MALICRETDNECTKEKKAYIVVHPIVNVGFPVGDVIISNIPSRDTYADPCRRYGEGLNIHLVDGSSGKFSEDDGHFTVHKPGKFVFSIFRKTAEKHLPKTLALLDRVAERRKDN